MNRHYSDVQYTDDVLARLERDRKARVLRDCTPDPLAVRALAWERAGRALARVVVTAAVVGVILALAH